MSKLVGVNHMLVTDLLVLFTVMANSAYDTAMGFPGQRDCLSAAKVPMALILAIKILSNF